VGLFLKTCAARVLLFVTFSFTCVFVFRFQEKGNLEVLLFTILSRMRANNQRVYTPKEGALVADINKVRRGMFIIYWFILSIFSWLGSTTIYKSNVFKWFVLSKMPKIFNLSSFKTNKSTKKILSIEKLRFCLPFIQKNPQNKTNESVIKNKWTNWLLTLPFSYSLMCGARLKGHNAFSLEETIKSQMNLIIRRKKNIYIYIYIYFIDNAQYGIEWSKNKYFHILCVCFNQITLSKSETISLLISQPKESNVFDNQWIISVIYHVNISNMFSSF